MTIDEINALTESLELTQDHVDEFNRDVGGDAGEHLKDTAAQQEAYRTLRDRFLANARTRDMLALHGVFIAHVGADDGWRDAMAQDALRILKAVA